MKKIVSASMILILLINLTACSQSTVESTPRVLDPDAAVSLSTLATSEGNITDAPPFEVRVPEYELSDYELVIDNANHTITGQYADENYTVDFDLTYYDYGVDEVSIYQATKSRGTGMDSVDLRNSVWSENVDNTIGAIHTFCANDYRKELSIQCALSYDNGLCDSYEDVMDLVEIINVNGSYRIHPYFSSYQYPIAEMNASVSDPLDIFEPNSDVDMVNFVTLRTELDGLPIGLPCDNDQLQFRIRYGDYYGSFFGIDDCYLRGFYNNNTCTQVDFIYFNYTVEQVAQSTAQVMPFEDCVLNALPGVLAYYRNGNCHVYAAELVYIPFLVGCESFSAVDSYDLYYVPVWAVYMVSLSADNGESRASTIFLNAVTGELVSDGL